VLDDDQLFAAVDDLQFPHRILPAAVPVRQPQAVPGTQLLEKAEVGVPVAADDDVPAAGAGVQSRGGCPGGR
jgi:hypothetical protein